MNAEPCLDAQISEAGTQVRPVPAPPSSAVTVVPDAGAAGSARTRTHRERLERAGQVLALALTSLGAVGLNLYTALNDGSTSVSHFFYIPAVLAGYWLRWWGVLYTAGLSSAYFIMMAATGVYSEAALFGAGAKAIVFFGISLVVAVLSSTLSSAQRTLQLQRDLALRLNSSESSDVAIEESLDALLLLPALDGAAFLTLRDGALAPHTGRGFSHEFLAHVDQWPVKQDDWVRMSGTGSRFDTYHAILRQMGLAADAGRLTEGLRGAGIVPVQHEDHLLGMLFVASRSEHYLRHTTQTIIELVAAQLGGTLERLQAGADLERRSSEAQALLSATKALATTTDYDELLDRIASEAAGALGCPECVIWEHDESSDSEVLHSLYQVKPTPKLQDMLRGTSYSLRDYPEERELLLGGTVTQNLLSSPSLPARTRQSMIEWGEKSLLNVPLCVGDRPIGLLVLIETERERLFTEHEMKLAAGIGEQAAVAIENARLYRRVQDQALQDGLTGLYNHRHFYERLSDEMVRARRYGQPLSLLMIDIDDFKQVNDSYGHPVGDEVLRSVAQVIRTQVRRGVDLAARYGGEEFALLLPNTAAAERTGLDELRGGDAETTLERQLQLGGLTATLTAAAPPARISGALRIAERIRATIAASTYATDVTPGGVSITVSIGVASLSYGDDSPGDLVAEADAALYRAKHRGKDRVVVFGR